MRRGEHVLPEQADGNSGHDPNPATTPAKTEAGRRQTTPSEGG